jgi:hypothetical protein
VSVNTFLSEDWQEGLEQDKEAQEHLHFQYFSCR